MAQVVVELSADEHKLLQSYRKIQSEQDKMDKNIKKADGSTRQLGDSSKRAFSSHSKLFGGASLAGIASYAAGALSAAAGVGKLAEAMRAAIAEADRLAGMQKEDVAGLGPLAQLAAVSADPVKEMRRLLEESELSFTEGAGRTPGEAGRFQFALTSAALDDFRKAAAAMKSSGTVESIDSLVVAISALRKALGPEEAGTLEEIMSRGLGASAGAPAKVEQIIQEVAKVGKASAVLGLPQREVFAAITSLAGIAGGPEAAGTQVQSLIKQIEKEGIKSGKLKPGRTLEQYVADIAALEAGGASVYDILGSRFEAISGYRGLRENPDFAENMRMIRQAEQVNAFQNMVSLYEQFPQLRAPLAQQQAENRYIAASTPAATRANLEQALMKDIERRTRERGGSDIDVMMEKFWNSMDRFVYKWAGDDRFLRAFMSQGSPETQEAIKQYLQQIADNTRPDSRAVAPAAQQQAAQGVSE